MAVLRLCNRFFFLMHSPHSTFSDFHFRFFFLLTLLLILPIQYFRKLSNCWLDRIIYPNLSSAFHLHPKLPPWKSLTLLEKHDLMTHCSVTVFDDVYVLESCWIGGFMCLMWFIAWVLCMITCTTVWSSAFFLFDYCNFLWDFSILAHSRLSTKWDTDTIF